MIELIAKLNQNVIFKFVSSIRLAVPVMLFLIGSIAAGTIYESLYSAEYAKIAVYSAVWFNCLLILLALNIFASMMSRYPWRKRHLGFVTTHIGILILLAGSLMTKVQGVDGSLQIQEGDANNVVFLPGLRIAYQFDNSGSIVEIPFEKTLTERQGSDLDFINDKIGHILRVERFLPYAEIEKGYSQQADGGDAVAVSFQLKSAFFNVNEWLHTLENPQMQMGPATLRLLVDDGEPQPRVSPPAREIKKPAKPQRSGASVTNQDESLVIKDAKTGKTLKTVTLVQLRRGLDVQGVHVGLKAQFQRAIVSDNKIVESEDPSTPPNPALELTIQKGKDSIREVLYGRYPSFSLNKDGAYGLRFQFQATGIEPAGDSGSVHPHGAPAQAQSDSQREKNAPSLPAGHPPIPEKANGDSEAMMPTVSPSNGLGGAGAGGNVVEFHFNRSTPDQVRVQLKKGGVKVGEQMMKEGDIFQTPWMGMRLFLGSIVVNAKANSGAHPVSAKANGKSQVQSAILVRPVGASESFWLAQGDVRSFEIAGRKAAVVFSNQVLTLPVQIHLETFTKKDYPGTETPYSYESLVTVENATPEIPADKKILISMNEPLNAKGFTFYQSSFSLTPGQKPVSILSVNRDPGRPVKYLGSLILSLGIIIFTLMRSRMANQMSSSMTKTGTRRNSK